MWSKYLFKPENDIEGNDRQRHGPVLFIGLTLLTSSAVAQNVSIQELVNHGVESPSAYGMLEGALVFSLDHRLLYLDGPDSAPKEITLPPELGHRLTPFDQRNTFQEYDGALFMHIVNNTSGGNFNDLYRLDSLNSEPVRIDVPDRTDIDAPQDSDQTNEFAVYRDKLYFFADKRLFALDAADAEPYQIFSQDFTYDPAFDESTSLGALQPELLKASEIGLTFVVNEVEPEHFDGIYRDRWYHQIQNPQRLNGEMDEIPFRDFSVVRQQQSSVAEYEVWNGSLFYTDNDDPFDIDDSAIGTELVRFDSQSGQTQIYDINTERSSVPSDFLVSGSTLYFSARPAGGGVSLFKMNTPQSEPELVIETLGDDLTVGVITPLAALNSGLLLFKKDVSGQRDLFYLSADGGAPIAFGAGPDVAFGASIFQQRNGNFQAWQEGVVFSAINDAGDHVTYLVRDENDTPDPLPEMSLTSTTANESDGVATVVAQLDRAANETVTGLVFTRSSADAQPGRDYTGFTRKIQFLPGETSVDIEIEIINDTRFESDEIFSVHLAELDNASAGEESIGQVTITDNDELDPLEEPLLQIEAVTGTVSEGAGTVTVTATLDQASTNTVKAVIFSQSVGSAVGGSDYYGFSRTLEFAPGQRQQTVDITILDDTVMESSETFTVRLTRPEYARLDETARQDITIDDDDTR